LRNPSIQTPVTAEVKRIVFRKLDVPEKSEAKKSDKRQEIWRKLKGAEWFRGLDNQEREHLSNQFHLIAFLARESQFQANRNDI